MRAVVCASSRPVAACSLHCLVQTMPCCIAANCLGSDFPVGDLTRIFLVSCVPDSERLRSQRMDGSEISLRSLQIYEVSHIGFAEEATTQPFFELTIRPGKAVMLPKVLRPGTHDKRFEIAVGGL